MLNVCDTHGHSIMFIGLKIGDNIYAGQKGLDKLLMV